MHLNPSNGEIALDGLIVQPTLSRSVLKLSPDFDAWENYYGDGLSHFSYRRQISDADSMRLLFTLYFHDDHLESAEIFSLLPGEPRSGKWENWSLEQELSRKALHDKFLAESLGAQPYDYAWGQVLSIYDERSAESRIIVKYQ